MANQRRESVNAPFGEHAKRLARAYEKAGVSDEERLIPYHMSNVYSRLMELLDTERNSDMIKKEMITPYIAKWFERNPISPSPQVLGVPKVELISAGDSEGYKKQVEQIKFTKQKIDEMVNEYWKDITDYLRTWIAHPFLVAGFHDARRLQGGGIGDALMRVGTKRDEKKVYYSSWYGRSEIIRISGDSAPSIYFVAGPGMGKTNGMHVLMEEMFAHDYWVYTNMPVVSEYGNCYIVRKISDIFIDTPAIPSILRSFVWAKQNHRSGGSYFVPDEGGMNTEAQATTVEGRGWRNRMQVRRHLKYGMISGGVQRLDPKNEAPGLIDVLIESKRVDTGKNKVITNVVNGKTYTERKAVYKYYWDVGTRAPNGGTNHELVYDIPFTHLKLNYGSELRLPYTLEADMIDYSALQREVDFVQTPIEELLVKTREAVRMMYRQDLVGTPYFGEEDTMSKQEKIPAVSKSGQNEEVSPDIIEAIGELRSQGLRYTEIGEELGLQTGFVVRACKEHNWH